MGCVSSEEGQIGITLYSSKSPLINNLSDQNKEKLNDLIQVDDILTLAVAMNQLGAQPNSEISDSQMRWMLTHLCCRWDSDNCLTGYNLKTEPIRRLVHIKIGLNFLKQLFISHAQSIKKSLISQTEFYKISTMKGQFVFIAQTESDSQYKIQFKFTKNKMQFCEVDRNKKSDIELEVQTKRGQPGIATMKRTEPASGGQTGPLNIQTIKG